MALSDAHADADVPLGAAIDCALTGCDTTGTLFSGCACDCDCIAIFD